MVEVMSKKAMGRELDFLKKYKELCMEYGLEIIGCGDCGSAWLSELNEEHYKHKKLCWKFNRNVSEYTNISFADDFHMSLGSVIKDNF